MLSRAGALAAALVVGSVGSMLSACGHTRERATPTTTSRRQVALLDAARKTHARQRLVAASGELIAVSYRGGDLTAATDRYLEAVAVARPRLGNEFVTNDPLVGTRKMGQFIGAFCEPCAAKIRRHE